MRTASIVLMSLLALHVVAPIVGAADLPPSDAGKNQLIIVGQPGEAPAKWFNDHPELAQVKKAVAFTLLAPTSKLFMDRYRQTLGSDFPIVAYLRPDGGVVYFADRNTMPVNASALFQEMKAAVLMARNAKPVETVPDSLNFPSYPQYGFSNADCPDGMCYPNDNNDVRCPRLRPLDNQRRDPWSVPVSGWFSDSISSGIWLVFTILALGVVLLFAVLIFGAMIVVARWIK